MSKPFVNYASGHNASFATSTHVEVFPRRARDGESGVKQQHDTSRRGLNLQGITTVSSFSQVFSLLIVAIGVYAKVQKATGKGQNKLFRRSQNFT